MKSVLTTAGLSAGLSSMTRATDLKREIPIAVKPGSFTLNIFSKCLHWLDYSAMATAVAEMGFEGIDLTVRPEGHVIPERVTEDLPKAMEIIKKAGLHIHMITTAINNADDPFTESILKTASSLGISYYRTGWASYDDKVSMEENLKNITSRFSKLAALNKKYNIQGHYQNHSGSNFGAPLWDLWNVLKEINSPWIGSQYDILHATVEGANSWPLGLRLLRPYIGTMDIKDFQWVKKDGQWKTEVTPLGEGMIDFKKYLKLLREYNIEGPFSVHFEYPLGGAENGDKVITMKKEDVFSAMKKDVVTFKKMIAESSR
jgi:sugar phosphate isomerase/epimerase